MNFKQPNGHYTILKEINDVRSSILFAYNYFRFKGVEYPICMEIGTQRGAHALAIRKTLSPKELYLVDCWEDIPKNEGNEIYMASDYAYIQRVFEWDKNVQIIKGYSQNILPSLFNEKKDYFDFIYIDGDHEKDVVIQDIKNSLRLIKVDGILAGHDYGGSIYNSGIKRASMGGGGVDGAIHTVFDNKYVYGEIGCWWIIVDDDIKQLMNGKEN